MTIYLFLVIFVSMTKEIAGYHIMMVITKESSTVIYYSKDMPELTVNVISPISPFTKRAWCSDQNENIVEGSQAGNEGIGAVGKNLNASDVMQFKIPKPKNSTWFCKFTGSSEEHVYIQRYYNITIVIYDGHFPMNIGSSNVTSTATDATSTATSVTSTATNVTSTATIFTPMATTVTSTAPSVASTAMNLTSMAANGTSTPTNVTSTATNGLATATNSTSMAANAPSTATYVTSMAAYSPDKKRSVDTLQPSMSPSEWVNAVFVGPALLVIGLLLGGLLYYRKQVKRNEIPDNIKSRAPMELPSEVIYETAYSHITGYRKMMENKRNDITGYQQLMEKQRK